MTAQARAALSGWLQGRPDFERLGGFGHVMHAHDGGAALNRQQGCGYAGADALLGRGRLLPRRGQRRPQRRFARPADQQRQPRAQQLALPGQQGEVLRHRLAKANARIQRDALGLHAMRLKRLRPLLQKNQHLRHRIARHGS